MDVFSSMILAGWITLPIYAIITIAVVWRALRNNFKAGFRAFLIRMALCLGLLATSILMIFGEALFAVAAFSFVVLLTLFYWKFIVGMSPGEALERLSRPRSPPKSPT